ncbi:YciI family protein [Brevibacillus ruminantium]|uniref:YciI family protein n=1 Tax=Brevibacillus ruminantium TaxID=2950604 RepID=A0ABY4WJU5_9BACL|nr:YciI family protein [Brevibacillus ruminantium]USG66130.1 YciI family protein [Brevibacillus ruminantium]
MKFVLMTKATRHLEAGIPPSQASKDALQNYLQELDEAGILIATEQFYPSSSGLRMSFPKPGDRPVLAWGPLSEVKELVSGFTLIEVNSEEEAIEWALRMPDPNGYGEGIIELRRVYEQSQTGVDSLQKGLEYELRGQIGMLGNR